MESLYHKVMKLIDNTHITENINYTLRIPSHLAVPTIHHDIKRIKMSEIFRVYRPDPVYALVKSKYVTNWGGVILSEAIRTHITTGNIVRVMFTKHPEFQPTQYEITQRTAWKYTGVIYCRILLKLDDTHCLACIENMYCSEYEDIIVVIHTGAVSEVPFFFSGNENLVATGLEVSSGEGFGCTGMGAAVGETEGEEEVLYDLNYEKLWDVNDCGDVYDAFVRQSDAHHHDGRDENSDGELVEQDDEDTHVKEESGCVIC
jgi:hypothetical protein